MLCYKDKTFCPFHESCKDGATCPDALTDKVKADAQRWWGDNCENGPPIAQWMDKPECFKEG